MSLSSLLHLGDLLRLILLLPQSAKIQDFTKSQISLKKFSTPECLLGLVTAEDLDLANIGDHLLQFINNFPGEVSLLLSSAVEGGPVSVRAVMVPGAADAAPLERLNLISNKIKLLDVEDQKKILKSLDTSSYTKRELLDLVRSKIEKVEKSYISGFTLFLSKDEIAISESTKDKRVFFVPQQTRKLE